MPILFLILNIIFRFRDNNNDYSHISRFVIIKYICFSRVIYPLPIYIASHVLQQKLFINIFLPHIKTSIKINDITFY